MDDKTKILLAKLTLGNTYEEYEVVFSEAGLNNEEVNMNITQLIDFTVNNIGQMTNDEHKAVGTALKELNQETLSKEYKELIYPLLNEVKPYISFMNAKPYKELRLKTLP